MRHRPPGSGWSSRLLQDVLLLLPTDAHSRAGVDYAKRQYAARRSAMLEALTQRDVAARGRDGTNLRVTVRNEQEASVSLALNGIAWRPGPRSCPRPYARSSARCLAPPTGPRRRHRQQDPPRGQRHPSSLTTRHCQGPGPTHLPPPGRAHTDGGNLLRINAGQVVVEDDEVSEVTGRQAPLDGPFPVA